MENNWKNMKKHLQVSRIGFTRRSTNALTAQPRRPSTRARCHGPGHMVSTQTGAAMAAVAVVLRTCEVKTLLLCILNCNWIEQNKMKEDDAHHISQWKQVKKLWPRIHHLQNPWHISFHLVPMPCCPGFEVVQILEITCQKHTVSGNSEFNGYVFRIAASAVSIASKSFLDQAEHSEHPNSPWSREVPSDCRPWGWRPRHREISGRNGNELNILRSIWDSDPLILSPFSITFTSHHRRRRHHHLQQKRNTST